MRDRQITNLTGGWRLALARDGDGVYWVAFTLGDLQKPGTVPGMFSNGIDWTTRARLDLAVDGPYVVHPALICDNQGRLLVAWSKGRRASACRGAPPTTSWAWRPYRASSGNSRSHSSTVETSSHGTAEAGGAISPEGGQRLPLRRGGRWR